MLIDTCALQRRTSKSRYVKSSGEVDPVSVPPIVDDRRGRFTNTFCSSTQTTSRLTVEKVQAGRKLNASSLRFTPVSSRRGSGWRARGASTHKWPGSCSRRPWIL